MVVDTFLKNKSVNGAQVIQHLAYRGYRLVEQLETCRATNTYVVQDNRKPEDCYCLVHASPLEQGQQVSPSATLLSASSLNIAQPLETFQIDGYSYCLRPYIHGHPLTWEMPTQESWSNTNVINLLTTVLSTLNQCHQQGISHGNLHPSNLIRQPDGSLVLTDFRHHHIDDFPTGDQQSNSLKSNILGQLGHWAYIAPEQWQGQQQPSSDIYAVGVLGIQLLLGRQPWTSAEQLTALLKQLPHQSLVTILQRMVNPAAGQRYINAQEALFALKNLPVQRQSVPPTHTQSAPPLAQETSSPSFKIPVDLTGLETAEAQLITGHQTSLEPNQLYDDSDIKQADYLHQPLGPKALTDSNRLSTTTSDPASTSLVKVSPAKLSVAAIARPEPTPIFEDLSVQLAIPAQPAAALRSPWSHQLKWTPAVLALTAAVGGMFWYHRQTYGEQAGATTPDSSEALIAQPTSEHPNPPSQPLPVPASPDIIVSLPKFSQSQQNHYFVRAYHHAKARNFSKALVYLEQVPKEADRYLEAQTKITEYEKKREIKAQALLSAAYQQATSKNFGQALSYLQQIPPQTEAHPIALEKITEYRHKQQFKASSQRSLG